jgi:hypothetical protein
MGLLTVDGDVDAIVACVDFSDLLEVTLPWNRSRFRRLVVITTPTDESTQSIARQNDCELILTEIFTARGAAFNRAAAIQQCLSWMQPQDWLVFLDADIMIHLHAEASSCAVMDVWSVPREKMGEIPVHQRQ